MSDPFPPGTPTDVARQNTITDLCRAWNRSEAEVKAAFKLIARAEARLTEVFKGGDRHHFKVQSYNHTSLDWTKPDEATERLRRQAWAVIAERLELRACMSLAKIAELDRQIETGEGLPPIRYADVVATVETLMNRREEFMRDKVHECYRWLRPDCWSGNRHRYGHTPYATNRKSFDAGVGEKVIIAYGCERGYARNAAYSIAYSKRDQMRALDQVFHLLDGAEQARTYNGELCDAVATQTVNGNTVAETTYFQVKCFANQNIHLRFKRLDLLDRFNLIAAGKNLNPPTT